MGLTVTSISDFWIRNLVKTWRRRGTFPVITLNLPRANDRITYLVTALIFDSQIFSIKIQNPILWVSTREMGEKGRERLINEITGLPLSYARRPSIGYCVCLCGEIIKWKDSMNLKKHMLTIRSSWRNLRLLWLVLYLFMRVCVPLVGVGALIDTAWPEDHETKACRTLLNFAFSLLSSLLVSIHLHLLSHTWCFGTTFAWHCDQESQCYQNSMRAEHQKNIYGLLCYHLPLIPPFSSLKP